jgi:hypothetical protein
MWSSELRAQGPLSPPSSLLPTSQDTQQGAGQDSSMCKDFNRAEFIRQGTIPSQYGAEYRGDQDVWEALLCQPPS